jgi:hypothetical protein
VELAWRRSRFRVLVRPPGASAERSVEVSGVTAGPFGIDPPSPGFFRLVHTPTGVSLTTLKRQKQCRELANELLALRIDWDATVPDKVRGPDTPRLRETIQRAYRASYPQP